MGADGPATPALNTATSTAPEMVRGFLDALADRRAIGGVSRQQQDSIRRILTQGRLQARVVLIDRGDVVSLAKQCIQRCCPDAPCGTGQYRDSCYVVRLHVAKPPSTGYTAPVQKDAPSPMRKATRRATSTGFA